MNRKEAMECLEVHAKELKRRGFEDVHLRQVIEYLQQPITLAEFLGWEEDVEYVWCCSVYKVVGGRLYHRYGYEDNFAWGFVDYRISYLDNLQHAKKVEEVEE